MYDIRKKFGLGDLVTASDLFENAVDAGVLNPNSNSLQDFDSFVVTNPDLVDEGIDVSGLRTTTDTSPYLLGNIPDYGGIQYEAYNPNRLSDLMRLYSGGFPTTDTAQIPGAIDTLVDTSGGGQDLATSDVGTGETGMGDLDGLTQSGTFAGQPTFTTTPGTTVDNITGDITNADGTYAGNIVDEVALTGAAPSGITGDPIDVGIPDNESGFVDPLGTMSGAPVVGDFSEPTTGTISDDRLNEVIGGQPMAAGPFDYLQEQTPLSQVQVPGLDYSQAAIDAERLAGYTPSFGTVNELTDDPTMQETISNAFTSARQGIGDLATASVDKIQEVGQSIANTIGGIYNGVDQTISVFGREINVPATLAGIAASQVVGAPINIAFGLAKAIGGTLPQSDPINAAVKTGLQDKGYEFDDIGRLTTGPMAGYSVESAFGDIAQATQERIDNIENRTAPQTTASIEKVEELYDFLGDVTTVKAAATAPQEDIDAISEDYGAALDNTSSIEDIAQDLATQQSIADLTETNIMDEFAPNDIQATDPSLDIPDRERGQDTGSTSTDPSLDIPDRERGQDTGSSSVGGTGTSAAADTSQGETGYGSCFIAGTKVTMSDGTLKNIENIVVGDKVKGHKNDNEVIKLDPTLLGDRKLYSFNNKHYFFTSEHPFMTEEGWKSIKPEKTKERDGVELYEQLKGELKVGDKLVTNKGLIEITDIKSKEINKPDMPLYNFNVSNDNSYIADGYVVHNKGGGSSKIVCTMMNEAYGFGSFRNKIWLRHSKDLAPEYQKGYHKIFLPLVKLSKNNKVLKTMLEHIAVHRTIDIRQESRGKVHLLGRVYRKILEPICYFVGKHG
jgi:hypothetical protein